MSYGKGSGGGGPRQRTENRLDGSGFEGTKLGDRSKRYFTWYTDPGPSKRHRQQTDFDRARMRTENALQAIIYHTTNCLSDIIFMKDVPTWPSHPENSPDLTEMDLHCQRVELCQWAISSLPTPVRLVFPSHITPLVWVPFHYWKELSFCLGASASADSTVGTEGWLTKWENNARKVF